MHVLIDARKLRDGGIGRYIHNLVSGLLQQENVNIGIIVKSAGHVPEEWGGVVTIHEDSTPCYSLRELLFFPKPAVVDQYDLFHSPHYTLPYRLSIPSVVTVHDLIHITHPERWYYPIVSGFLLRSAIRRAQKILTVSRATAAAVSRFAKDNAAIVQKLHVVPNAVAPEMLSRASEMTTASSLDFDMQQPYLLSVCSTAKPHKGTKELLEAFALLKSSRAAKTHAGVKLVIAGQGVSAITPGVPHNDDVVFLGEVAQHELHRLYGGAKALVVSSRAEGFCLPVLEAQAQHVRVVTTPIPAVEDLVMSQDTVASDFTAGALAHAIRESLNRENGEENPEILAEYERHLARFNRDALAREVLGVYHEALESEVQ